ncbi:hypothetical protein FACS1894199_01380 [Bacteroidia bacterium]|nr:hypothetical protein FACS1894199_01380 [Bacteroidia bacterium]
MTNAGAHGSLLEEAKKVMFDILNSYPTGTGFVLLTNDNNRATVLSKEEASISIAEIKPTAQPKKLSQVFKQTQDCMKEQASTLFLLSDFQKNNCDFQSIGHDDLISPVFLLLKAENASNIYVKDVSFDQTMLHKKNQADNISIRIANSSGKDGKDGNNIPISLTINNKKKSVSKVNIPENGEEVVHINYLNTENGYYKGMVEVTDFPVLFDNTFYFSYAIDDKVNILCIDQETRNPFFGKLFADTADFRFKYVPIGQTAGINFSNYHLVILDRTVSLSSGIESELENYLIAGGNLFIVPGNAMSVNVLNQTLRKLHASTFGAADTNMNIATVESQSPLFKDVFEKEEKNAVLPSAKLFYPLASGGNTEVLMKDKKGNNVFTSNTLGQGKIYISAFNLEAQNSDMVYHPLFVPTMINMSYNVQSSLHTSWFLGTSSKQPVHISGKKIKDNVPIHIRKIDGDFEFIPEIRKDFNGFYTLMNAHVIEDAGLYEVIQNEGVVDVLAFNYDRAESDLTVCDEKELQTQFPNAKVEPIKTTQISHNNELVKEIVYQDKNRYLAWWFILVAVIALLLEQLVWRSKLK